MSMAKALPTLPNRPGNTATFAKFAGVKQEKTGKRIELNKEFARSTLSRDGALKLLKNLGSFRH